MTRKLAGGALGLLLVGGSIYGVQSLTSPTTQRAAAGLSCDTNITSPIGDRANKVYVRSSDSLVVTVSGTATRCPNTTVTVTRSENGAAETAVGTPSTNGAGVWTQGLTLTDTVTTVVFARMTIGGRTTEDRVTYAANTALPKLAVTAPAGDGFGVLRIVAPHQSLACGGGGNSHHYLGEPGWVSDSDCADGGQVAASFTVTGGAGGTYDVSYAGSSVASGSVTSSPETFTPTLNLPDRTRGDLVFSATNGAGTTSITDLTRVLVSVPPAVVGPDGGAVVATVVDSRNASASLQYVLPAVPADIESASIEIQWTTHMVAYTNNETKCFEASPWQPSTAYYRIVSTDGGVSWATNDGHTYRVESLIDGGAFGAFGISAASGGPTGTGASIVDGDLLWNYKDCRAPRRFFTDGGPFDPGGLLDGGVHGASVGSPLDLGVFLRGDSAGLKPPSHNDYTSLGLTYRHLDECVLYDPSTSPQVWECDDGTSQDAGTVRTSLVTGLPPLNTYYFWVLTKY